MKSALFFLGLTAATAWGATFYVDDVKGNDTAAGTSPETAWQTLGKVNTAEIKPGDSVLFRRGGVWRGGLRPASGSATDRVTYSAYGDGPKPVLEQSIERSKESDWRELQPGIWVTESPKAEIGQKVMDFEDSKWTVSFQEGAAGTLGRAVENGWWFNRVKCEKAATMPHQIQLWGPAAAFLEPAMLLRVKVRSSIPFSMKSADLMENKSPWSRAAMGLVTGGDKTVIGKEWQTIEFLLAQENGGLPAWLHFSIGGMLPEGAVFDFSPLGIWRVKLDRKEIFTHDVGIFLCNHGEKWGVKKWKLADVKAPLDYWYNPDEKSVAVAFGQNPAKAFKSIELALTLHVVNENATHDVTYDGLAVRYTGAHGFGGGGTENIIIRNCDVYWIGGGLQFWHKDGYPVRFGNGIEFWGSARNNLVEHNRLWEIYDAALTNQGRSDKPGESEEINITWRDNVIWHAEYSFEYWNGTGVAHTEHILFEHNTCVDSGYGWAHNQRPDKNGAHLMFYHNAAATRDFIVRNNIFCRTADYSTRMENDWRAGQALQNNLYWTPDKPVMRWQVKTYYSAADFTKYQKELNMDAGSVCAEPQFVDPANHDYRLKPGTVGTALATDGGAVGAR